MPRPLVVGNGRLLITFDGGYAMRDLYYPHVGMLNQLCGHKNPLGVWVDGRFSWVGDGGWRCVLEYEEDTLVTRATLTHEEMGLRLVAQDAVHVRRDVYLKRVQVHNLVPGAREVRLFFPYDLCVDQTDIGDTALYDPSVDGVLHYKRDKCFLITGLVPNAPLDRQGVFQYATGTKRFAGAEGTWRDAEDGHLEGNPIAQGSVDSVISFRLLLPGGGQETLHHWIAVGRSFAEVRRLHGEVRERGLPGLLEETRAYWRAWVNKRERDWADLPPEAVRLFKRSLLIVRTQMDHGGAILAANDSDILQFNRDHYSYMWPRDGALVAHALDRAGYPELTRSFYRFCAQVLAPGGFFWHKYNPDRSVGSSWHPWIVNGQVQLPIQEDETALVLWALGKFFDRERDLEFIESLYDPLIKPAADFLAAYRDGSTGLPLDSYDLWEERRGVFTFTAAAVCAGLLAAARFARLWGETDRVERYRRAAEEVRAAVERHLYSPGEGRFLRGLLVRSDGTLAPDPTPESSVAGLFLLDAFSPDDPRVVNTMEKVREALWVQTPVGGVARYFRDYYFSRSDDFHRIPGNPWVICTLWVAQWYIATARGRDDLRRAAELLAWVVARAMPSGVLAEQYHPETGQPLSVAPLTWSHATFVWAVLDYVERHAQLRDREVWAQAWHLKA
ncbi:MAG TPA: glycoside hydrolase family 15 protein [Limnochordales bacterium]|nr:glycoside hydrolase family 15 protein [Limnochordales bacterium]